MFCPIVGRTSKGAGQLLFQVSYDRSRGADTAPLFYFCGRNHHQTFQVMRRRLQGIKHTDCTARTIFGRRNRCALAAQAAMETLGGIYDPALKAPESGNDRVFPLYHTDAGQSNSSLAHSIKGVTFCPASFLLSRPIRRYVCFFEENQKKYARNERNVYFSTFTMYLVNQTMPRLLMRTYIQLLSSVKCRLTFSALFS